MSTYVTEHSRGTWNRREVAGIIDRNDTCVCYGGHKGEIAFSADESVKSYLNIPCMVYDVVRWCEIWCVEQP